MDLEDHSETRPLDEKPASIDAFTMLEPDTQREIKTTNGAAYSDLCMDGGNKDDAL